jgi:hypothetical protein
MGNIQFPEPGWTCAYFAWTKPPVIFNGVVFG